MAEKEIQGNERVVHLVADEGRGAQGPNVHLTVSQVQHLVNGGPEGLT